MTGFQAVSVLLEDRLITLNRAVGLIRRRNLPVRSLAVGPTATPGVSRLTLMIHSDMATADRAVQHLQKMIGVRAAVAFPSREGVARELALVKVRAPHERYGELLDVVLDLVKAAGAMFLTITLALWISRITESRVLASETMEMTTRIVITKVALHQDKPTGK